MSVRLKLADVSGEAVSLLRSPQTGSTVREYVEGWLSTYAEVHCKPTTAKGYRQLLTVHVYPLIGDRRLDQVARADIKHMIGVLLGKKLKKSSVHNILTPLKEAYHHAIDDGLVASNPVVRTGRFTRTDEDRRATIQPLTRTEVGVLLEAAEVHAKSVAALLLCAVRTGLRQGELIGLQWGDVDVHGGFIEVRRAIVRGQLTTTKTRKIRRVDVTPQLMDSLKQLKDTCTLEAAMSGKPSHDWVFLSPLGCRWDERNLRRAFYKVLETAKLRRVRFHDLRHTYASLLIQTTAPRNTFKSNSGMRRFKSRWMCTGTYMVENTGTS
jgi:integrase